MDDTSLIWFALRGRRASLADRSKVGETAARRQTFAAAMAQFEEQITAAKIVTPATRPLNLYYGLVQAGMAVAAAHAPDPWGFSSHGLKLVDPLVDLPGIQVRLEGDGAFQRVASATGSASITAPVSVGALWTSLPDLAEVPLSGQGQRPPLDLMPQDPAVNTPRATVFPPGEMLTAGPDLPAQFYKIIAHYPGAVGGMVPAEPGSIQAPPREGNRWAVTLEWPPSPPREMSSEEIEEFFDGIAPEYRYHGERFLRPSVEADGTLPPSPLMTWWLLLYSFSIIARYQPRKWAALLDLDKSEHAVNIQYALEAALSALPHLVLDALDGRPSLLSKPLSF